MEKKNQISLLYKKDTFHYQKGPFSWARQHLVGS